jgi:hypothetical protein
MILQGVLGAGTARRFDRGTIEFLDRRPNDETAAAGCD